MKNVILTGSTGGIGSAVTEALEASGYRVLPLVSRLEDIKSLDLEVRDILEKYEIDVLINCAGFGLFRPHEEIPVLQIIQMVEINLTAPMILVNLLLRSLKKTKGHIINISSIEATRHSKFSALYTATKSGLRDFSLSLFEEVRKSGVRVTSVNPDITHTAPFDNLSFGPGDDSSSYLNPEDVGQAVLTVLESKAVMTDLTIRPQRAGIRNKSRS
ncbi:MAG: SDR family NAD(P)-dependent oxidoreductase [Spirochaetaceae bacterium]|nr:SDR family NAD(P)-dependent oxidoreductase [Spirochaetaceae bacterium]